MTARPPLPDGTDLPATVNGWRHDPTSNKNGHIWAAPEDAATVGVFALAGVVHVSVSDDRLTGLGRSKRVFETEYEHTGDTLSAGSQSAPPAVVREGIEAAISWMQSTDPGWDHPAAPPEAFDPPVGFVLDRYYLTGRRHTICYRQVGTDSTVNLHRSAPDSPPSLATRDYLYVEAWRGSGDASIALAPWLRADSDQKHEVLSPPPECGVGIALKLAREWVQEETGETPDQPPAGQSDISQW